MSRESRSAICNSLHQFFGEEYAAAFMDAIPANVNAMHARLVVQALDLRPGQRVLDLPCGTGRLTLPLARMGLRVTGVDLVARYVEQADERARREGFATRFLQGDMREIAFDREFDAVVNWGDSIGYFPDDETLRFFERVRAALRPGGRFLVEFTNKTWLRTAKLSETEVVTRGMRIRQCGHYDAATSRFLASWTYAKGEGTTTNDLSLRVYNRRELRSLLRAAGFRGVRFFQSYPFFGPPARDSRGLLAVARRPTV